MSNNYLKSGFIITRVIKVISIIALIFIVGFFAGYLFGWLDVTEWLSLSQNGNTAFWFLGDPPSSTEMPAWTVYFILIRFIAILSTWIFILHLAQRVLQSVDNLKTFQVDNILHFRKIAFGFLILAALDILKLNPGQGSITITFSVTLAYFMLSMAAFLLSDVFKEGNELYEQNRLMI